MKGQILGDFLVAKQSLSLLFAGAYSVALSSVPLISRIDADSFQTESERALALILVVFIIASIWLQAGVLCSATLSRGNVRQFAVTFPQGKMGYVLSKYLFCILMTAVGVALCVIVIFISGLRIEPRIALALINVLFITLWLELSGMLIFGDHSASAGLFLVVLALFGIVSYILFGDLTFLIELTYENFAAFIDSLSENINKYLTIANIALAVISFAASCRFLSLEKADG